MSYSPQHEQQQPSEAPRPLTPQELHERQRELVRQSLSVCPGVKHAHTTHRRWA
ncbi:MAG: hypothetical protein M3P44_03875 [Actinomycetota bacterium]|nr:hypothetical protein [Actinomycetota bacterium]